METLTIILSILVVILIVAVGILGHFLFKVREQLVALSNKSFIESVYPLLLILMLIPSHNSNNDYQFFNTMLEQIKKQEEEKEKES